MCIRDSGAGEAGFAIALPTLFEKSGAEGQYRRFKFEMLKLVEKNALPGYGLTLEQGRGGDPLVRMRRIDGKDGAEIRQLNSAPEDPAALAAANDVSPGKRAETASGAARRVDGEIGPARQNGTAVPAAPVPLSPSHGAAASRAKPRAVADSANERPVDASALIRSTIAGLSDAATRGYMTDDTIEHLRATCPGWDLHALHADFERWVDADAARLPANWQKAFIGWVKRHHDKHRHQLRG